MIMASSHGNASRITGHPRGESTRHLGQEIDTHHFKPISICIYTSVVLVPDCSTITNNHCPVRVTQWSLAPVRQWQSAACFSPKDNRARELNGVSIDWLCHWPAECCVFVGTLCCDRALLHFIVLTSGPHPKGPVISPMIHEKAIDQTVELYMNWDTAKLISRCRNGAWAGLMWSIFLTWWLFKYCLTSVYNIMPPVH